MWLDRTIRVFARNKKLDVQVLIALRLGAYQLKFLDRIPAHSAINDSVELVRRARKSSAKGLVNAVLRKIATSTPALEYTNDLERLSVEGSHPAWLVERWMDQFGPDETAKLVAANNTPPQLAFRVLGARTDLVDQLIRGSRPSEFVDGCFITENRGSATQLSEAGEIYIQDEGSQVVAAALESNETGRILDVCAAPGGKTGMVASRTASPVIAGDLHWHRVWQLRNNCSRQEARNVHVLQYDARDPLPFLAQSFDAVLVDAPCTGTGTIRHNPEVRYFLSPGDLVDLPQRQLAILGNAAETVRSGGQLVYSTCSLEREENEAVIETFLAADRRFTHRRPSVPGRFVTEAGYARTWPHRDAMDGFFIAALQKRTD